MKKKTILVAAFILFYWHGQINAQPVSIEDASGITRAGNDLLMVGGDETGVYLRYPVDGLQGPMIPIDQNLATRVTLSPANLAVSFDAIDVLNDGRVVALSKSHRALLDRNGTVARYDQALSAFGNRGLNGLAVQPREGASSRVAVLWDGGYPDYRAVPVQLQRRVGRLAMRPVVWVHDVGAGERGLSVNDGSARIIELDVPELGGREPDAQRFRAPDLVWHKVQEESWGFIILLASQNSPETRAPTYRHYWLQQFTFDGKPLGRPLDLKAVISGSLRDARWEGLGWFVENESLVLIHGKPPSGPPTAVVVDLPDAWKSEP